ncbi:MAG: LacI family DNA-binding transcriptional regulator [Verrucomicrobiota bacterium]|nr:LacI family DNA-binding transcriptional regulator [Verrucomicrobiota bacterium]
MPGKRISIGDIARLAEVSRASVCRALHGDSRLSDTLKRKVRKIADEMGYQPDPLLSKLAQNRWGSDASTPGNTIAYLCSHPTNKGGRIPRTYAWEGIQKAASSMGYHTLYINYWGWRNMDRVEKLLRARNITGLIIGPISNTPPLNLKWKHYSVVDQSPQFYPLPAFHKVGSNPFEQVQLASRKAIEYGYKRIGLVIILHQRAFHDDLQRYGALQSLKWEFQDTDNFCQPLYLLKSSDNRVWNQPIAEWYTAHQPDAVIGFTNYIQYALKDEIGVVPPKDYAFCNLHRNATEAVAGVNLSEHNEGVYSVRLLDSMLRNRETGIPTHPIQHRVALEWVDGDSMPRKGKAVRFSKRLTALTMPMV